MYIQGESTAVTTLITAFTTCLQPDDMLRLGRSYLVSKHEHGAHIRFHAIGNRVAMPPQSFAKIFAVAFARSVFDKLPKADTASVRFKWCGRELWKGQLDIATSSDIIASILQVTLSPITHFQKQRLVSLGKRFYGEVRDLQEKWNQNDKPISIHLVGELWGGAGPGNGAKGQQRQQIKNSFAASLLEQGVDLNWVSENVDKLLDRVGLPAAVPIAGQSPGTVRDSRIKQLFQDAGLPVPPPCKGVTAPIALRTKQRRKTLTTPNAADYRVNCQYILNEDDTAATQIYELKGHKSGIMLADAATAAPWIREGVKLTGDELGLLVIGHFDEESKLEHQKVTIPCFDCQQQQVLLSGKLYQLGAKKLRVKPWEATAPQTASSRVVSITMWQSDWTEQQWQHALSRTNQFIREVLSADHLESALEGTWGRSLRRGKQLATIHDASSIQIHATIADAKFSEFLAVSGFNFLWIVPKEEGGNLSNEFRILWVPHLKQDLTRINTLAAQIPNMSGLVKGRNTLGLRIAKESFQEGFKLVYPGEAPPEDIPNTMTFRLEPLPYGTNAQMIREWSKMISWSIRPIRAIGPKAWLICSGSNPPSGVLSWNNNPILPTLLPPRQRDGQQAIVAGPRARQDTRKQEGQQVHVNGNSDPWMNYLRSNPSPFASAGASQPAPARQLQGPVEQKLSAQDERIKGLEQQMASMTKAQDSTAQAVQQLRENTASMEQRLGSQLTQAVATVKQELTNSFNVAFNQQQQSFDKNLHSHLREMKALLIQTKRKGGPDDEAVLDMES